MVKLKIQAQDGRSFEMGLADFCRRYPGLATEARQLRTGGQYFKAGAYGLRWVERKRAQRRR